jgi:hypothetical protein
VWNVVKRELYVKKRQQHTTGNPGGRVERALTHPIGSGW